MNEGKDLKFSLLLDYYGMLLTDKQRNVMELYYNEDLSLGEIAEHERITRQGVRDSIKRGEAFLDELEHKLNVCIKMSGIIEAFENIKTLSENAYKENRLYGNVASISALIEQIYEISNKFLEEN